MNPDPVNPPMDHVPTLRLVRARIAEAVLDRSATGTEPTPEESPALGRITLRPHQLDAVIRLRQILGQHQGALLADDVGLGKTFVALGVARHYDQVRVIAPAALREMWHVARAMAELSQVTIHSLQAFSRPEPPTWGITPRTLVILDEAHALRHRHTARYRAVARAVTGCHVLCISATPIHNRPAELAALFALFRSQEIARTTRTQRQALIVRRREAPAHATPADDLTGKPTLVYHTPHDVPQDAGTLEKIVALPDPLPARDGATAGALIRLGLLRAWCSSDAALAHTLRRRRLRGAALCDALRAGHHPTPSELRTWVVGEFEGQLAFPELLSTPVPECDSLLVRLERHLEALAELAAHHARTSGADAARAELLRELLHRHGDTPIVAFAQHARTVEALYRALMDIAGIGLLTGRQGRIASGPVSRPALLHAFAPRAHGRAPPPPAQRVRLLLTTDLLAEGVNLQDAGVVVHLDLPWTDALRRQREGRCARLGSPHREVAVYRLRAPVAARALHQMQRLLAKRRAALLVTGSVQARGRSHPEQVSAWRAHLQRWRIDASGGLPDSDAADVPVVRQRSRRSYALVVLRSSTPTASTREAAVRSGTPSSRLLVLRAPMRNASPVTDGRQTPRLWRVTADRAVALRAVEASRRAGHAAMAIATHDARQGDVAAIRRAIRQWARAYRARGLTGHRRAPGAQGEAWHAIDTTWDALSRFERVRLATVLAAARRCVEAARGIGAEAALRAWCGRRSQLPPADWLRAWQEHPALDACSRTWSDPLPTPGPTTWRWHAALLLGPD